TTLSVEDSDGYVSISLDSGVLSLETDLEALGAEFIPLSQKGAADGVAELDENGKVLSSQLPSYVDDVLEGTYVNSTTFNDLDSNPYTPESGIIYIDTSLSENKGSYRWTGTQYTKIEVDGLVLGETSS